MTPVLVGSRAINFWLPEFSIKPNTDWDIISDEPISGAEHHNANFLNNRDFAEKFSSDEQVDFEGMKISVMSLTGLALMKRSHLWRTLGFQKHITHFHKWLSPFVSYEGDFGILYQNREELTRKEFGRGSPSLMKSKQEFFDDAVNKTYDHDWLHELVAFSDRPMYERMLREFGLVWCEKSKWDRFTQTEKLQCVLEETYVIALERFLLTENQKIPHKLAFFKSLEKVCTTLCSGWFRDFAIDFYPDLCIMYDQTKLENAINRVKNCPHSERSYHVS